ncbi:Predicted dehydrogenase [Halorubrum aquaticum]|uniref:Predicted dehydrogenase n=1 Tax=Halorubrum aquaticum TaxID=387340 RepID=A0A1I3AFV2_9EURY|nr:Gfo/Idh/MocA family oxidoreductase [Halorubrum aquaticum]SFH48221.1 Predicted dehydrogenase [Halorubrum aquaticum]
MTYRVAMIGTGEDPETRDRDGFAMAYRHASGYQRLESCSLVACADIVPENAEAFAEHHGLDAVYEDHEVMLEEVEPDIVSICVPPAVHADLVVDSASAASVDAVHCEKPMATTWGDSRRMVDVCDREGVQLTIDHQRRLAEPVLRAKELLDDGEIGELERLEWSEVNLFDAGSHLFDLCDLFVDGARAEWVLAAIDCSHENRWFGALNETRSIAQWRYADGTLGVASTAEDGVTSVDAYLRVVGEDGTIEIQTDDGTALRVRTDGKWRTVDTDENVYGPKLGIVRAALSKSTELLPGPTWPADPPTHYEKAIEHLVDSLSAGTEPVFSGRRALRGTELVFASWESARQRGRVHLPLELEGNPLEEMYEAGQLGGSADWPDDT